MKLSERYTMRQSAEILRFCIHESWWQIIRTAWKAKRLGFRTRWEVELVLRAKED